MLINLPDERGVSTRINTGSEIGVDFLQERITVAEARGSGRFVTRPSPYQKPMFRNDIASKFHGRGPTTGTHTAVLNTARLKRK